MIVLRRTGSRFQKKIKFDLAVFCSASFRIAPTVQGCWVEVTVANNTEQWASIAECVATEAKSTTLYIGTPEGNCS